MQTVQGISHGMRVEPAGQARSGGGLRRVGQRLVLVLALVVLTACGSLQSTKPQEPGAPPAAERREVRLGLALGGGAA